VLIAKFYPYFTLFIRKLAQESIFLFLEEYWYWIFITFRKEKCCCIFENTIV